MKHTSVHRFMGKPGYEKVITADNSNLKNLGFGRILLEAQDKLNFEVSGEEIAVVLQNGDFMISVEWDGKMAFEGLKGTRSSVFDEKPFAIYLPPGSKVSLESKNGMEARVFSAPCEEGNAPFFCRPDDVEEGVPGDLNFKRKFRFVFGPPGEHNDQITKKLIVGESVSVPGGWIGFPAHRHDFNTEKEYPLDEIFSFKLNGPEGAYVLQHSYGVEEKWDEVNVIDGDDYAVALAEGYHTSLAAPGCTEYLLWGLAGKEKIYKIRFDERFKTLGDAEALYKF
jgi:5-deoxy-glucuronate isomerase